MTKLTSVGLAVAIILFFVSPPALALNCTKFKGDEKQLCHIVNPFPISENEKRQLMKSDLYDSTDNINQPVNLYLNLENQKQINLNSVYEDKIVIIGQLVLFFVLNYSVFSILTKSFNILKWLSVDS